MKRTRGKYIKERDEIQPWSIIEEKEGERPCHGQSETEGVRGCLNGGEKKTIVKQNKRKRALDQRESLCV